MHLYLLSQPHFEVSVNMKLTLPKVGTWSPPGLPKFHSLNAKGKTSRLEVFFIPLEKSQSVDVQNGLAWIIWTATAAAASFFVSASRALKKSSLGLAPTSIPPSTIEKTPTCTHQKMSQWKFDRKKCQHYCHHAHLANLQVTYQLTS
jgi:hypothetical protein